MYSDQNEEDKWDDLSTSEKIHDLADSPVRSTNAMVDDIRGWVRDHVDNGNLHGVHRDIAARAFATGVLKSREATPGMEYDAALMAALLALFSAEGLIGEDVDADELHLQHTRPPKRVLRGLKGKNARPGGHRQGC